MARLFGTDGVRGVANRAPMTAETVLQLGRATAYVCKKHQKTQRHRIVIGKDTRVSGYMLESALTAGMGGVTSKHITFAWKGHSCRTGLTV